jgi:hypothetical protein
MGASFVHSPTLGVLTIHAHLCQFQAFQGLLALFRPAQPEMREPASWIIHPEDTRNLAFFAACLSLSPPGFK